MTRYLFLFIICALQAVMSPGWAQETQGQILKQKHEAPVFKQVFDVWLKNRRTYRQLNDSVFLIRNYKDWSAFFKRRSVMVHQMYEEDKKIMQDYAEYYQSGKYEVTLASYNGLRNELYRDLTAGNVEDPFVMMAACDVLEKNGALMPDSIKCTNLINALRLFGYIQMWNQGGEDDYMRLAYQCGKALMSDEAKKYPYYDYSISAAMRYMPRTWWLIFKLQTIPEYKEYCRRLGEYLAQPNIDQLITPSLKQQLQQIYEHKDEALVRNTYLVDNSTMDKQEADSMMHAIIKRNLANPNLSALAYVRTLYMQMSIGQLSAKEARNLCLARYQKVWARMRNIRMNSAQLNDYLQPFYTFFYLNYKAEVPIAEKTKTVQQLVKDIEYAYMNRKNQRGTTEYVRDLLRLSTYDKVTMYLTPEEVEHFLNALNIATQPASFAHSLNTAKITDEIVQGVLKYRPELFVGLLGCEKVQDVNKNKKKIQQFAHQAALYHDIGKNSIASLINKGHRPLMSLERKLMDSHPRFADRYLSQTPALMQYKDVAFGHHKWYNDKGGFPEDFDNTKSPYRILIDVVAIADCMQDAAENAVRSEGYSNPLIAEMENLRQGAGTKYNPDLVSLIDGHKEVKDKIAWLVDEGWIKTSYEVANKYFANSMSKNN